MITLGIRYLTGTAVASDVADRNRVEWPPHPGRVFMALAAAHFETGDDPAERAALEWIEALPAPQICASAHMERPVVRHYVPVNDKAGPSKAPLQSAAGLTRERQPRTYARAWLEDDTVYLTWPEALADGHFRALAGLCEKVTRIGHSVSLVQVWATQSPPPRPANWVPNDARPLERLRVTRVGVVRELERRFNRKSEERYFALEAASNDGSDKKRQRQAKSALKEEFEGKPPPRLRPELSLSEGYGRPAEAPRAEAPGTVFDPRLLVFPLRREDGPVRYLDLTATLQLTTRFREALLEHLGANAPEVLTGHSLSGRSERPHLAFLPLPFVGHEHAHGGILGVAVALPREMDPEAQRRLHASLWRIRQGLSPDGTPLPENEHGLKLGRLGRWTLDRVDGSSPANLREGVWTALATGAREWATVTPYVYDRHPKAKEKAAYREELAEAIRASWQRARQRVQPEVLVQVVITPVSPHLGAPPGHVFPRLTRKDGSECRHTHAILIFDRPVVGPLLLGAGRYRGYGMCRPMDGGA